VASDFHRRIGREPADTLEAIEERLAHHEAAPLAHQDMLARFGALTPDNAMDAMRFQEQRIADRKSQILARKFRNGGQ
jgi:hypothetical protein